MTVHTHNKFGFIVHCRTTKELRQLLLKRRLSPFSFFSEKALKSYCLRKGYIASNYSFPNIVSDKQKSCEGKSYCLLLTPDQFLEHQVEATALVKNACVAAQSWGAQMIGLGAITAVVGSRGLEAAKNSSVPITTGNSLTVYASIAAFERIIQRLDIDPSKYKIVIVGSPGSIALALAKILNQKGLGLVLVSRHKTAFLERFANRLKSNSASIETTQNLEDALRKGLIIFSATSTGQIIDPHLLLPGSIVIDIAQPRDVIYRKNGRKDVLIIDGGTVSLPRATKTQYRFAGWGAQDIPACLAETITLTFENRWENFSIGRDLHINKINEIGRLSEKHGFIFNEFRSFQVPIAEENFEQTKRALHSAVR